MLHWERQVNRRRGLGSSRWRPAPRLRLLFSLYMPFFPSSSNVSADEPTKLWTCVLVMLTWSLGKRREIVRAALLLFSCGWLCAAGFSLLYLFLFFAPFLSSLVFLLSFLLAFGPFQVFLRRNSPVVGHRLQEVVA